MKKPPDEGGGLGFVFLSALLRGNFALVPALGVANIKYLPYLR